MIGLNLKGQLVLKDLRLPELEEDLKRVRGIYFRTSDTEEKKEIRKEDKKIRNKISSLLKESGFPSEDTKKIAEWDPYNSNKSADWFDPEWMFGIKSPSPLAREGWDEGGFDIVIGNPPYVRIYRNNIEEKFLEYLKKSYVSAFKKFDLYVIFIEKGISLLNKNGFISFIVPDKWLTQPYGQMIRNLILTNCNILLLMDLTAIKVFESSTVDNFVFLFKKEISEILNKHNKIKIIKTNDIFKINNLVTNEIEQSTFKKNTPFLININQKSEKGLIKKIEDNSISLQKICYVNWGCRPTPKEKYVSNYKINEKYKPLIVGSNISKYRISTNYRWVKYVRDMYNPMFKELFENITIVFKDIIGKGNLTAALNIMNYYADFTVINAIKWKNVANLKLRQIKVFQDYKKYDFYDVKFILGIVNSRLESFYFNKTMRSGLHTLPNNVKNLLVPVIAETGQKNIINLVDTILSIHEQYGCPLSDGASAKVKECEHQIDQLVYKLYDLTEEEIKIVKSSTEKYK